METKHNNVFLESLRRSFGFDYGSYVDPEGLSGGLALWWQCGVSVEVDSTTKNIMQTVVFDKAEGKCWAASFVYGCPSREGRGKVWQDLKDIGTFEKLPWLCIGDFNEVLTSQYKMGGNPPSPLRLLAFHDMLTTCGMEDLGFKGPRFTWRNKRTGEDLIMERLDMAFANTTWREIYTSALVLVEAAVGSDHNPLILDTSYNMGKTGRPFRFESFWTTEAGCREVVVQSWAESRRDPIMLTVCKKLRKCKEGLKMWHKAKFGNLWLLIDAPHAELLEVQRQMGECPNPTLEAVERSLVEKLEDLWQKDSLFWHQRSRVAWLKMGDRNTRFFHLSASQRRQMNQIVKLKDESGAWQTGESDISGIIQDYFNSLYCSPPIRDFNDILSFIDSIVTPELNDKLVQGVTVEEVRMATFQMGPLKAPGSDGFPGIFFQKYWDVVGNDIFEAVSSFFHGNPLSLEWNHTNVTLIPKNDSPESMRQLRPISLCRFIYKIISKVMANRLQPSIDNLISEQQSAFIPGRQIQNNIIIAHEVFHFLRHKKQGSKAYVAIKLDLNKAYDRVCWDFLLQTMEKMGFHERWIDWVRQCICTVKYSIFANRKQVCHVLPKRGLRQGDPLSPYLFLLAADVFSIILQKTVNHHHLKGIKMKKGCPVISHLFFADDSLIFLEADPLVCEKFKVLAHSFGEASGLHINPHKSSILFSANTSSAVKENIKQILGMEEMRQDTKYLGLPALWGRSKTESLTYLRDRLLRKMHNWGSKTLNHASKEVLIKSKLQPLAMYPFMCFKAPSTLCAKLNSTIGSFWWGKGDCKKGIHWGSWGKLTKPKGEGGLGFREFSDFNDALLAKQFWNLSTNPTALWARILKGLYFPKTTCWQGRKGPSPSWAWSSLLHGRELLQNDVRWNVGNGEMVNF